MNGSSPFVHGLVHSQRVKGDLSYSRFRAFASSEGLDIFAPKVLERDVTGFRNTPGFPTFPRVDNSTPKTKTKVNAKKK